MNKTLAERAGITSAYDEYQKRYKEEPRESDKVLLSMIAEAIEGREKPRLLDVGCSTGNLLSHISRRFSWDRLALVGGDLLPKSCEIASAAVPYAEIRHMNMLDMRCPGEFD